LAQGAFAQGISPGCLPMKSQVSLALIAAWCLPLTALDFEWAGIFEVPDDTYLWTAQKVDGEYADATMKIVALPASAATKDELSALEVKGKESLGGACSVLDHGAAFAPAEDTCYQLRFHTELWQSLYTINMKGVSAVAFFAEHVPTEFESTAHYLKDQTGEDVEPMAELPEEEAAPVDWLGSIGAALVVNLITLVGVILAVPGIATFAENNHTFVEGFLSAFAAGALLACAFFLLLFESTHLIGEGWDEEVAILWRWGTAILAGFFFPMVVDSMGLVCGWGHGHGHGHAQAAAASVEMSQKLDAEATAAADVDDATQTVAAETSVLSAVLLGDFFHNLCDGFFIAAAFKGCGAAFAWGVVLSTCLHELPQELADYAILTGSDVGFKPTQALIYNFVSGLSVVLGVIIVNLVPVSDAIIGLMLAFGGGVYVYLASVVCMPKVAKLNGSVAQNLSGIFAFVVGTVLIGLILLDHKHCGDGHGHAH